MNKDKREKLVSKIEALGLTVELSTDSLYIYGENSEELGSFESDHFTLDECDFEEIEEVRSYWGKYRAIYRFRTAVLEDSASIPVCASREDTTIIYTVTEVPAKVGKWFADGDFWGAYLVENGSVVFENLTGELINE